MLSTFLQWLTTLGKAMALWQHAINQHHSFDFQSVDIVYKCFQNGKPLILASM